MARRLVYKGSLNGTGPVFRNFPVNSNQTIYAGDVVILSSGKASILADDVNETPGSILGVSNTDIATTTAGADDIIAVDINPASIYEAPYNGDLANVAVGDTLDMHTAGYIVDTTDETTGCFQVLPQPDGTNANTVKGTMDVLLTGRVYGMA